MVKTKKFGKYLQRKDTSRFLYNTCTFLPSYFNHHLLPQRNSVLQKNIQFTDMIETEDGRESKEEEFNPLLVYQIKVTLK